MTLTPLTKFSRSVLGSTSRKNEPCGATINYNNKYSLLTDATHRICVRAQNQVTKNITSRICKVN